MKNPLDDKPELSAYVKQQDVDAIDNFVMEMNWRQLRALRVRQSKRQREIANAIGVSDSTYSKIENGKQMPSRAQAVNLAGAFGFNGRVLELAAALDQELRDVMEQDNLRALHNIQQNHKLEVETATMNWTAPDVKMTVQRKRIPYYSIIGGPEIWASEQTILINQEDAGLIPTPPMLSGIDDAYAMNVPSDSMAPRYSEGDTIYVHPGLAAKEGDDVVIRLTYGEREIAFVREVWRVNAPADNTDKDFMSFELVSQHQKMFALMQASAFVGDNFKKDLLGIIEGSDKYIEKNKLALLSFMDGKGALTGADKEAGVLVNHSIDVIVGCERKRSNASGRGKGYGSGGFGSGPFGG